MPWAANAMTRRRSAAGLARSAGADSQAHGAGRLGQSLPNDTTVIIRWNATQTLPDGSPYANHGVHIVQMRCGRIIAIDANEHSQVVAESMPVFAAAGVEDALAEPITS